MFILHKKKFQSKSKQIHKQFAILLCSEVRAFVMRLLLCSSMK